MKKILVVTTHTDIEQRLAKMLNAKLIPEHDYSIVVEFFEDAVMKSNLFKNVFTIDDLRDREAIDAAVKQCGAWGPFDQVIATDEYAIVLAAELRESLGIGGSTRQDILKYRDKVAMKESLHNSTVRVPALYSLEQIEKNSSLLPVVVKPRSYAGSKGIKVLKTETDIKTARDEFKGRGDSQLANFREFSMDDVEFEEFIDGRIFHLDGLVFSGKVIFCQSSEYVGTCLEYVKGNPLGSQSVSEEKEKTLWLEFAQEVNRAMELPNGAFHLEVFLNKKNERVFLEIGIRPGGALVVPSIESATGLNLDVAHFQCQLGIIPVIPKATFRQFGWLIFPKKFNTPAPKVVSKISHPDFSGCPSLSWYKLPKVGDSYTGSFAYIPNLGSFVFTSSNGCQLSENLRMILETYSVVPGDAQ